MGPAQLEVNYCCRLKTPGPPTWGPLLLGSSLGRARHWTGSTGCSGQGGSAPKVCRPCVYTPGFQFAVHECLTPCGEQICGCMNFFTHMHTGLLLCLVRSVPHPLFHDLVRAQMPLWYVLVLCVHGCGQMHALGVHVEVYNCVL